MSENPNEKKEASIEPTTEVTVVENEIKKVLEAADHIPKKQIATLTKNISGIVVRMSSSVVPPPDFLDGYEHFSPGATNRFLNIAEAEIKHRHEMDKIALDAEIKIKNKMVDEEAKSASKIINTERLGIMVALIIGLTMMGITVFFAIKGYLILAGSSIAVIATCMGVVIYKNKHEDVKEKDHQSPRNNRPRKRNK